MSYVKIPLLNPIKYSEIDPAQLPKYLSRHFEKYRFVTTIPEWQTVVDYGQLYMTADTITQQLLAEVQFFTELSPIRMQLINAKGQMLQQVRFEQMLQNLDNPGEWVYENSLDLSEVEGLTCGVYYLKILAGETEADNPDPEVVLISEPICICETIENSLLLEYQHDAFYGDVFFETGIFPSLRLFGSMKMKNPASRSTVYEDAPGNLVTLDYTGFEIWQLVLGGGEGIPDYLIRRLNRVLGCSTLLIDGKRYVKPEGSQLEVREMDGYPMRAWVVDMREAEAIDSVQFES